MFIFSGSFNWDSFIVDQNITIVFPSTGFLLENPVYIFFQWTKEPGTGSTSVHACFSSIISSITFHQGVISIVVNFDAKYSFNATIGDDYTTLSLTMSGEGVPGTGAGALTGVFANPTVLPSVAGFYTGTFKWPQYVDNQMVTITVPCGVVVGAFVGLFHKWTKCPVPPLPLSSPTVCDIFVGTFTEVQNIGNTTVASALCPTTGFTCTFTFQADRKTGFFSLYVSEASPQTNFSLQF